jgi:hypothetical protein
MEDNEMKKFAALLLALGTVAGTAVAANAQGYYFNSRLNNPWYQNNLRRDWIMRHRFQNRVYRNDFRRWENRVYRHDNGWHRGWDRGWHRGWHR